MRTSDRNRDQVVTGYRALIRFPDTCPVDIDPHAAHTLPKPLQFWSPHRERVVEWIRAELKGVGRGAEPEVELWEQVERAVDWRAAVELVEAVGGAEEKIA